MILISAALAMASATCQGVSTQDIMACAAQDYHRADTELNLYYNAATKRLQREGNTAALTALRRSERMWIAYRDGECGAVFAYWSPGTIAAAAQFACMRRITQARTMAIWTSWLGYADTTPALLPKPTEAD